jgi:hypothetical protein
LIKTLLRLYQQQSKNISQVQANNSKFVSSRTLNERNEEVEVVGLGLPKAPAAVVPEARKLTEEEEAAIAKNYGQLTRKEFEFRPHPTLCKRFNIPDPHPNNVMKEYGTVKDDTRSRMKSEKYSIFNYMTASARFDSSKSSRRFRSDF